MTARSVCHGKLEQPEGGYMGEDSKQQHCGKHNYGMPAQPPNRGLPSMTVHPRTWQFMYGSWWPLPPRQHSKNPAGSVADELPSTDQWRLRTDTLALSFWNRATTAINNQPTSSNTATKSTSSTTATSPTESPRDAQCGVHGQGPTPQKPRVHRRGYSRTRGREKCVLH